MDHFESPRNRGVLEPPSQFGEAALPSGAPLARMYCRIENGLVQRAMYQAEGCGVTIACCSVLTVLVTGRPVDQCLAITAVQVEAALDGLPFEKRFCASSAIEALHRALT